MVKGKEPTNIIQMESMTQKTTKEKHWREIEIFTGILNTFTNGFNCIGSFELKEDNESEYIWLLILLRSLDSIRCSIDLMLKGYYSQTMSLLRTVTEDWLICGTVQENKNVRDCLLRDVVKMPRYKDLAKQMEATNIYDEDYHYQSKFTHSTRLSLRVLYNLGEMEANITPSYDDILFLLCTESLMRVSILMLDCMWHLLSYIDKDQAIQWDKQNNQHISDVSNWLKELRVKYGGEVERIKSDKAK